MNQLQGKVTVVSMSTFRIVWEKVSVRDLE